MTPTHQPLPAPVVAASTTPAQPAGPARLLRLWAQLACRVVAAEAHDQLDQEALRMSLRQVEDALAAQFPGHPGLLDELVVLESRYFHLDGTSSPQGCLLCRRARLELPLSLPLPGKREVVR